MNMMRNILVCLLVLGLASSAFGAKLIPLPSSAEGNYSNAKGVYVDSNGVVYVAGATRDVGGTTNLATYWKVINLAPTAPIQLPTNAAGTKATAGLGITVMDNGEIVVGGNLAGGVSDWRSMDANDNGWKYRYVPPAGGQATLGGQANQITKKNGTNYWNVGKNASSADVGISYDVTAATGSDVSDTWSMVYGGATSKAGNVQGISTNGVAVGQMREGASNTRRAYIHDALGVLLLPADAGASNRAEGYAISADGMTAGGLYMNSATNIQGACVWKDDGLGNWSFQALGRDANETSTAVVYAVDDTGQIVAGWNFPGTTQAAHWDMNVLDGTGKPEAEGTLAYMAGRGADVSGWVYLYRNYAVTTVGGTTYLVGDGYWSDDGGVTSYLRGYVAVFPEPATLGFLALGGLALLRRRRH